MSLGDDRGFKHSTVVIVPLSTSYLWSGYALPATPVAKPLFSCNGL